jgi:hypothetical protein
LEFLREIGVNLVVTLVAFTTGWLGRDFVLPVLRGRLRDLPQLNRTTWHRRISEEDSVMTILEIRQSGTAIKATVTRNEQGLTRKFIYRGHISGQQIVLNWADSAAREQVIGAMVLYLSQDLRTLSGSSVYFKHRLGKVISVERVYDRVLGASPV